MDLISLLAGEFERELAITRRVIDAIPDDRFDWKPAEKSFSVGMLAGHLAEIPGWGMSIITTDRFDEMGDYKPPTPASRAEVLAMLDENAGGFLQALRAAEEAALEANWVMTMSGQTFIDDRRYDVLRTWIYNHVAHHRGQLTVYLRLLGISVPEVYGPTADSAMPA
ncbi:MAG: DinB family protein [Sumerlaeia bacterium]